MHRIHIKLNRLTKGLIQVIPVVVPDVGAILSGSGSMTAYFPNGQTTPPLIWEQVSGVPVTFTSSLDEPTITFTSNDLNAKEFKCTTNPTDAIAAYSDTGLFLSYPIDVENAEPVNQLDSVLIQSVGTANLKVDAGVGNYLPGTDNINTKENINEYTSLKAEVEGTLLKIQILVAEGGNTQLIEEMVADPYLSPYFILDNTSNTFNYSDIIIRVTQELNGHIIVTDFPITSDVLNTIKNQSGYKDNTLVIGSIPLDSKLVQYESILQTLTKKDINDTSIVTPSVIIDSINTLYDIHLQSLLQYTNPNTNDTTDVQPTVILDSVQTSYSYTLSNYIGVT